MNRDIGRQIHFPTDPANDFSFFPHTQMVDNGRDLRMQQQMHFAQPTVLKSHKPVIYYQDTQPENSLIPSQLNRNSYRQATLSDYNTNYLPDGNSSPPTSHYSAKTEPSWRKNQKLNNQQLKHVEYFTQRRPSPTFPRSEMETSNSQIRSKHFRFRSQELYRGNMPSDYNDALQQPVMPRMEPDGYPHNTQPYPQSNQLIREQLNPQTFEAYPPYYHPNRDARPQTMVQQTASFHPNPNYSGKVKSHELLSKPTHYQPPMPVPDFHPRPIPVTISSVPALHHALSPTEAKAQELVRQLMTSQDITTLCRAATIIQQMSYGDDVVKDYFREVGGIQALVSHLQSRQDSVLSSALGALRNLSYGVELNKREIAFGWGLSNLMQLLLRSQLPELRELATSVLWNVSSSEHLKREFLDMCVDDLVRSSVIPLANWDTESIPLSAMDPSIPSHVKWNAELKNSTGVLRNLASFGKECRKRLRSCIGLVDSVLYIICSALGRDDLDNQIVENCVCILRNLSYRVESEVDLQEGADNREIRWDTPEPVLNPNYSISSENTRPSRKWYRCFCISFKRNPRNRAKSANKTISPQRAASAQKISEMYQQEQVDGNAYDHLRKGVTLLWQPEIVDMYILILKECSNRESVEATLGAILNLTACEWKWAAYIRTAMRNKKGLPLIINVITTIDNDLIVKSASTVLRNLSQDQHNKVLIGDYAMVHLVERLPGGKHCGGLNDACYQSLLNTINQLIQNCPDNINRLYQNKNCIGIIAKLACSNYNHSPKTIYLANKVCLYLYEDKTARPLLKKEGWNISNWQKVVDWLEQETSSAPSDSNLSGPYGSKNASLKNAIRPRAKSDSLAEKKQPSTHRTFHLDNEANLFREASIVSGSSRTSQATNQNSLISQQPGARQRKIGAIPNTEGYTITHFASYNPHKKLHQTISYPDAAFRHPLEQVHRDSPVSFTTRSPRATPDIPDDTNLINSHNFRYIPDLSAQQKEITNPRVTPLDPSLGVEIPGEQKRTPSPNPSVTTGQQESRESLCDGEKGKEVEENDIYSKVDVKKKRERRLTTHIRPEDLPNARHDSNHDSCDQSNIEKLPSKYNPIVSPQLMNKNTSKEIRRSVNLRFDKTQATDSWV